MGWVPLLLLTCSLAPSAPPVEVKFQLGAGLDSLPALRGFGPSVRQATRADGRGLWLTLPANRGSAGDVGIQASFRVRGDFTLTAAYEWLSVGESRSDGAGIRLSVLFDAPTDSEASVARLQASSGEIFEGKTRMRDPEGNEEDESSRTPARAKWGMLRLVRSGTTLSYLAADGGGAFREIGSAEVEAGDVKRLRLACTSGGSPTAVRVRFTELSIQADELPNEPATLQPAPSRLWLWILLGLGATISLAATAYLLHRRRLRMK